MATVAAGSCRELAELKYIRPDIDVAALKYVSLICEFDAQVLKLALS